jgi:hypothetical protein
MLPIHALCRQIKQGPEVALEVRQQRRKAWCQPPDRRKGAIAPKLREGNVDQQVAKRIEPVGG